MGWGWGGDSYCLGGGVSTLGGTHCYYVLIINPDKLQVKVGDAESTSGLSFKNRT